MKRIAVILSGCGVYDGAEIHESVLTFYELSRRGIAYELFAPDVDQAHVINHLNDEIMDETRNVLIEAARIARGNISELGMLNPEKFDALLMPGGFGVAKNLCTFAFDGPQMKVDSRVKGIILSFYNAGKVIGALCISPVLIASVLNGVKLTVGNDETAVNAIISMGGQHQATGNTEVVVDKNNKVVTGPCYMLDSTVAQIGENIKNVVDEMLALM